MATRRQNASRLPGDVAGKRERGESAGRRRGCLGDGGSARQGDPAGQPGGRRGDVRASLLLYASVSMAGRTGSDV